MTIAQMENFITVADVGSFSSAAQMRYISPQALIQQIAKMETELGFKLFVRSSKGVKLSPAGEVYYSGVKAILSQYRECTGRAAQIAKKAGILRIGFPDNINSSFLLSICSSFSRKHPEIRLHYENYSINAAVRMLQQGRIDICAQIKSTEEGSYLVQKLFPVRHFCLIAPDSPLAGREKLEISDLFGQEAGVWGPISGYQYFSDYIAEHGLDIRLRSLPENFSEALLFCVEGNVLIAAAPILESLKGSLKVVPIDFDFRMDYYLAYTNPQNEAVRLFLSAAREAACDESHPWKKKLTSWQQRQE